MKVCSSALPQYGLKCSALPLTCLKKIKVCPEAAQPPKYTGHKQLMAFTKSVVSLTFPMFLLKVHKLSLATDCNIQC